MSRPTHNSRGARGMTPIAGRVQDDMDEEVEDPNVQLDNQEQLSAILETGTPPSVGQADRQEAPQYAEVPEPTSAAPQHTGSTPIAGTSPAISNRLPPGPAMLRAAAAKSQGSQSQSSTHSSNAGPGSSALKRLEAMDPMQMTVEELEDWGRRIAILASVQRTYGADDEREVKRRRLLASDTGASHLLSAQEEQNNRVFSAFARKTAPKLQDKPLQAHFEQWKQKCYNDFFVSGVDKLNTERRTRWALGGVASSTLADRLASRLKKSPVEGELF